MKQKSCDESSFGYLVACVNIKSCWQRGFLLLTGLQQPLLLSCARVYPCSIDTQADKDYCAALKFQNYDFLASVFGQQRQCCTVVNNTRCLCSLCCGVDSMPPWRHALTAHHVRTLRADSTCAECLQPCDVIALAASPFGTHTYRRLCVRTVQHRTLVVAQRCLREPVR